MLFAFGGTGIYFILGMFDGDLLWVLSVNGVITVCTYENAGTTLCNGQWHTVRKGLVLAPDSVTKELRQG